MHTNTVTSYLYTSNNYAVYPQNTGCRDICGKINIFVWNLTWLISCTWHLCSDVSIMSCLCVIAIPFMCFFHHPYIGLNFYMNFLLHSTISGGIVSVSKWQWQDISLWYINFLAAHKYNLGERFGVWFRLILANGLKQFFSHYLFLG